VDPIGAVHSHNQVVVSITVQITRSGKDARTVVSILAEQRSVGFRDRDLADVAMMTPE